MKPGLQEEFATHDLARGLNHLRDFWRARGLQVILGISGVIVLAAIVLWWQRSGEESRSAAWTEYAAIALQSKKHVDSYEDLAEDLDGDEPAVANWSRWRAGELLLEEALPKMFVDRDEAVSELKDAIELFQAVLSNSDAPSTVRIRAQLGLARALEATWDGGSGDSSPKQAYETLINLIDGQSDNRMFEVYKVYATARVASLEREQTKDFYAWFADQDPEPKDIQRQGPIDRPVTLPEIPDRLKLPELDDEDGESALDDAAGSDDGEDNDGDETEDNDGDEAEDNDEDEAEGTSPSEPNSDDQDSSDG